MKQLNALLWSYILKPKGMMIWRDIPDYDGRYQISNHGDFCLVKEKILSGYGNQVVLTGTDKIRRSANIKKLMGVYWNEGERYKGDETWKKLDLYGEYYISNYAQLKNYKRFPLSPNAKTKTIVLTKRVNGKIQRDCVSVTRAFLFTFPPYEVEINNEDKTINYVKKNENISDTSIARTA